MKALDRFNIVKPLFEKAYKEQTKDEVVSLTYENGWCFLEAYYQYYKIRVSELEKMTETLRRRLEDKAIKDEADSKAKFYELPTFLQRIWDLNPSIARQAEKDYIGSIKIQDSDNMEDLPLWLQELWSLDRSLARQSEAYFKNRNVGFKTHRLESNPEEQIFHNNFRTEHLEANHGGDINLLVFPPADGSGSTPSEYLTDREKDVMVSTIQWLGSPVGQAFLNKCGYAKK